jgi:hypothetical protein
MNRRTSELLRSTEHECHLSGKHRALDRVRAPGSKSRVEPADEDQLTWRRIEVARRREKLPTGRKKLLRGKVDEEVNRALTRRFCER